MLRTICLILLTTFFICKATDVMSILLAKEEITAVCNSGDCENEKPEVEKNIDDLKLISHYQDTIYYSAATSLKTVFTYSVTADSELFRNLFSPPPELA